MALLSTLSTAVDLVGAMRERRLGRDPSEQQAREIVIPSLADGVRELDDHLIALRASLVAAERESSERVVFVRHMNDLILLGGLSRDLHGMHQRLMSLYPDVSENLVEDARRLHRACSELIDTDVTAQDRLGGFIEDTAEFLAATRAALAEEGPMG